MTSKTGAKRSRSAPKSTRRVAKSSELDKGCVSKRDLCGFLGVVMRSVDKYVEAGMPAHPDGSFHVATCAVWRHEYLKESRRRQGGRKPRSRDDELDAIELEAKRLSLEIRKLELEEARGERLDRAEVEASEVSRVQRLKRDFETLEKRLPPKLVGKKVAKMREVLRTDFRRLMQAYSDDEEPFS